MAIITIDRTHPFDPATFIGEGWGFWRGPAAGNGLEGELEEDARARALTQLDISKILLECHLDPYEHWTIGDEQMSRLITAERTRLDLDTFQMFWNDKLLIPDHFTRVSDLRYFFFDGQTLHSPHDAKLLNDKPPSLVSL